MRNYRLWALSLIFFTATVVAVQAAPVSTLIFSESLKDHIVCDNDEGEVSCDVISSGSFSIVANFPGVYTDKLDEDTTISLEIGNLWLNYRFGDTESFCPKKKNVQFVEYDFNDLDEKIVYLTVRIKWNSKSLTLSVKGKTPYYMDPIFAGEYHYQETGKIDDNKIATVILTSGDGEELVNVLFNVSVKGNVKTKEIYKCGNPFTDSKVTLKGIGEPS